MYSMFYHLDWQVLLCDGICGRKLVWRSRCFAAENCKLIMYTHSMLLLLLLLCKQNYFPPGGRRSPEAALQALICLVKRLCPGRRLHPAGLAAAALLQGLHPPLRHAALHVGGIGELQALRKHKAAAAGSMASISVEQQQV
jgi:hypothetical protein